MTTVRVVYLFLFSLVFGSNLFAARVGLLVMATGRYDAFVEPLIQSARKFFCPGHEVTYYVFTDGVIPQGDDIVQIYQKRLGWPYDTLMRNTVYFEHRDAFAAEEYLYALDADMLFTGPVGCEIFGTRVATMHPGFATTGATPSYENNPNSTAYVPLGTKRTYVAGGFFGGSQEGFLHILSETTKRVRQDLDQGIIALWHDESQWNRYCMDFPPDVILTPSYCYADLSDMGYPKNMADAFRQKYPPKLWAITKDHKALRE